MGARPSKGRQATPATSSPPSNGPDFWPVSSSSSPWTDLQPDLADRVRFTAVCRHWRYVAREYSLPRLPPALPWLFQEQQAGSGIWRSRHSRYLRNPLSGATVRLPGHCDKPVCLNGDDSYGKWSFWKCSNFDISKVIVCSDDLVAAMVLYHHLHMGTRQVVMCCRPGMSSWSRGLYNINHWYIDMAFYKGKLYTVTREGCLFAHEVGKSGRSAKGKPRVHQIQQVSLAAPSSLDGFFTSSFSDMSCYLVISHTGKLWMVRWVLPYGNKGEVVVKVFKADLETSQWLESKLL
ncbi:unnamed protein product [Urochloa decumbens]|uniref:KIB1-4 beta-propeller domain-containing protein n=1 Tax=Urochloa decumbens TaxID=240449 RepID=A0ABC9AQC5_9POAL